VAGLSRVLRTRPDGQIAYWCPGCNTTHAVRIAAHGRDGWTWNGDVDRPSFHPSILTRHYQISPEGLEMIRRGERPKDRERYPGADVICHCFVRNGRIEFLNDCTHALAGQTVDMPKWTEPDTPPRS